jgi:signal transduction histidine kinase
MTGELERCGAIISGLLSFSRESAMAFRTLDLNDILTSVIALTRHKMDLQDIRLNQDLFKGPLKVDGDVSQLQQCFLNLIFNAIEAMPQGGHLDISSKLDAAEQRAIVTVRDTGCGIPKRDMDRIFEPFFTTKPQGEGTGLGLSIVHGIVKSHHGEIHVDSEEGLGAAFILSFPLQE